MYRYNTKTYVPHIYNIRKMGLCNDCNGYYNVGPDGLRDIIEQTMIYFECKLQCYATD